MPHQHVSLTLQNHAYWHQVTFHVMMRPIWSKTNWEEHNLINTVMRNEHLLVNNCGIVIFMWPIISYYEVQPYCSEFKIEMHSNVFKSCYFYTFTVNHRTGLLLNVWNCWKSPPKTGLLTPHPHPPDLELKDHKALDWFGNVSTSFNSVNHLSIPTHSQEKFLRILFYSCNTSLGRQEC